LIHASNRNRRAGFVHGAEYGEGMTPYG
jgi:hypothetical protein